MIRFFVLLLISTLCFGQWEAYNPYTRSFSPYVAPSGTGKSPDQIAGLALQFEYDTGFTASEWTDQASGKNLTQSNATNQPSLGTGGIDFDGNDMMRWAAGATAFDWSSAFTLVIRFKTDSDHLGNIVAVDSATAGVRVFLFRKREGAAAGAIEWITFNSSQSTNNLSAGTVSNNVWHTAICKYDGAGGKSLQIDDATPVTSTVANIDSDTGPLSVGANGAATPTTFLNGFISHLYGYTADVSQSDIDDLKAWLATQ